MTKNLDARDISYDNLAIGDLINVKTQFSPHSYADCYLFDTGLFGNNHKKSSNQGHPLQSA
jgi:hypothetical protein